MRKIIEPDMPCYVMCMFYFNPDSNRDCTKKEF